MPLSSRKPAASRSPRGGAESRNTKPRSAERRPDSQWHVHREKAGPGCGGPIRSRVLHFCLLPRRQAGAVGGASPPVVCADWRRRVLEEPIRSQGRELRAGAGRGPAVRRDHPTLRELAPRDLPTRASRPQPGCGTAEAASGPRVAQGERAGKRGRARGSQQSPARVRGHRLGVPPSWVRTRCGPAAWERLRTRPDVGVRTSACLSPLSSLGAQSNCRCRRAPLAPVPR